MTIEAVDMLGIATPSSIRQVGAGNANGNPATVMTKDGINILVENLTAGTLYLEINNGKDFKRFDNLSWSLASLPGMGFDPNVSGSAAIFVQIARGIRYRLTAEGTTDLIAQVIDTGNT